VSVKEEIIRLQRINVLHLISSNLVNTAGFAENILCIKKPSDVGKVNAGQ